MGKSKLETFLSNVEYYASELFESDNFMHLIDSEFYEILIKSKYREQIISQVKNNIQIFHGTLLIYIIKLEKLNLAEILIDYLLKTSQIESINLKDAKNRHALTIACKYKGSDNIVRKLISLCANINLQDIDGKTPLIYSILFDSSSISKELILRSANLDIQDNDNNTALMEAIKRGNNEIAKLIIDHGANLNLQNEKGYTALIYAIITKNIEILDKLIMHDANINIKDNNGYTALMIAILISNPNYEIVRKLIASTKANLDAKDKNGLTALYHAINIGAEDVVLMIIGKRAKIAPIIKSGNKILLSNFAKKRGFYNISHILSTAEKEFNFT